MKRVIKKTGKAVWAYKLDERKSFLGGLFSNIMVLFKYDRKLSVLERLVKEGRIRQYRDGRWEIFSREAVNGKGEIANPGDYIKVDSDGYPYPNSVEYFEKHHRHLGGNEYEQIPDAVDAWDVQEDMCPEIKFLMEQKGLVIHEDSEDKYFEAPLWGSTLSAARDAVIIFYSIQRDKDGKITDVDFNFIARTEFNETYEAL